MTPEAVPGPPASIPPEILVTVSVIAALLAVWILFIRMLHSCLLAIPERHRQMEPGSVWLLLIPFFGVYWMFMVVFRLSDSFRNAFEERNAPEPGTYGRKPGLAMCLCAVASAIMPIAPFTFTAATVCFISYWIGVDRLRKKLESQSAGGGV